MATPDRRVLHRPQGPGRGSQGSGLSPGSLDDLPREETQELAPAELAMLRKAQEFFQTCDAGGKGFIARSDMQRLHKELPLSLEDLEDVFDALDADGNGFLTPGEFTTGFSHFRLESGKEPAEKLWRKARHERGSGDGMGGLCFSAEMPMDHRAADVHQSSRLKGTSFQRNL